MQSLAVDSDASKKWMLKSPTLSKKSGRSGPHGSMVKAICETFNQVRGG